ncbi:MAG: amino acid permease [Melioribacteraceae bacterium]|nr:amino acid permease [Melioribacteraceae bacterium]
MGNDKIGFGTMPVFLTAISTILGAILFLRFGFAVGVVGFWGVIFIILIGHMVTIPTSLAISEIATNQRVEGGGLYFVMSRSFGLNIGTTIGIALYLSQAISVAFYVIAFAEAFEPFFDWFRVTYEFELPRQVISVPSMVILSWVILKKGADIGVKLLYIVVAILFISLFLFFIGTTTYSDTHTAGLPSFNFRNPEQLFFIFAIIFPAFTGNTAGVGLSGDLKNPKKAIPIGTISATFVGMLIYILVVWKLSASAPEDALLNNQFIMSEIAIYGWLIIPIGLAASTISSAIGSVLVAPRTLQAIAHDKSFPVSKLNTFLAKGEGKLNEPTNATLLTCVFATVFVLLGDVNAVAEIISMFFMVTYGSINLISFLYHFGADPSYRPTFQSRWYFSLAGAIISVWLMFQMNTPYALASLIIMVIIYLIVVHYHSDRKGLESIFQGAIFQFSRKTHVYLQRTEKKDQKQSWRPSAICISPHSFERDKAYDLLNWISYKHGFGTYIHLIEGYYSRSKNLEAKRTLDSLLDRTDKKTSNVYMDTLISPSYTSAIAQLVQLPSPSGMENNMILFEFDKNEPEYLNQILENISLVQAGDFDVVILGSSKRAVRYEKGIHVWIRNLDKDNANLMILLSYIILGHPAWSRGFIKIFNVCKEGKFEETKKKMAVLLDSGRLPITDKNIEIVPLFESSNIKLLINEKSANAGLTMVGFLEDQIKHEGISLFEGYDNIGDVLFIESQSRKELN